MSAPNKEYLYVGYYIDKENQFVLKIGTTNNLERRQKEHTRNYAKATHSPMRQGEEFHYLWHLPLSKYNTLRYEDLNREMWRENAVGVFIQNDRFLCNCPPAEICIKIRKSYNICIRDKIVPFFLKKIQNFLLTNLLGVWYNWRPLGERLGPNF